MSLASLLEHDAKASLDLSGGLSQRVTIIADDLTGACDAGVAFLVTGRRVRVVLGESMEGDVEEVRSITTESRNLPAESAARRVAEAVARVRADGGIIFKKIDSVARGPVAAEVRAALQASHAEIALLAPAFPAAGRVVEDGVLRVRDASGLQQEITLQQLFGEDGPEVAVLVEGSRERLRADLEAAVVRGTKVVVCSARVQDHLDDLVAAASTVKASILWVGSAGLAHALAKHLAKAEAIEPDEMRCRHGRTILFAGTPHPLTTLQIAQLGETHIRIEVECGRSAEREIRDAFAAAPVAALILTGGDTAAFVLRSLRAESLLLRGEVARGIPWCIVAGGLADGCLVITKSGGFGEVNALRDAFEFCERRQHEST